MDTGEAFDRGTIESDALLEGTLKLCRSHCNGLEEPEDVREPQANESDIPLFDRTKHELSLLIHVATFPPGVLHREACHRRVTARLPDGRGF